MVALVLILRVLYRVLLGLVQGNYTEQMKVYYGLYSAPAFWAGVCRFLSWLCGIVTIVLLLIYLI